MRFDLSESFSIGIEDCSYVVPTVEEAYWAGVQKFDANGNMIEEMWGRVFHEATH